MGKRTPIFDEHVKLGATIVDFAGWDMPVQYTSVIEEHTAARTTAGLFDTSHMGEFMVSGPEAEAFLRAVLTNDVKKLTPGQTFYSVLPNEKGGCVDDLYVYMLAPESYMMCVNASNADKDFAWLVGFMGNFNVKLENVSDETGMIALQGPKALEIISKLTDVEIPERFHFVTTEINGAETTISRTGYTGEDGVELYIPEDKTAAMWNALLEAGKDIGIAPVGLGARDTLRLEACYSLYGHELTDDITPVEAGVGFAVAPGLSFPGSDVIYKQKEEGTARRVVAFELKGRGVPREHYPVHAGGAEVGQVTSGCFSPTLKKGVGMVIVDSAHKEIGTEIEIEIRGRMYPAVITKKPFYSVFKK